MKIEEPILKKILLDGGYITQEDQTVSEDYAKKHKSSFIEYFLVNDLITPDIIGQAISEYYNVPYFDLNSAKISKEQIFLIPEDTAKKYRIVVIQIKGSTIHIATDNPQEKGLKDVCISLFPDKKIKIFFSLAEDIDSVFSNYRVSLDTRFLKIIEKKEKIAPEIVNQIILDALSLKASDIHFEPQKTMTVIRFRIDGVLQDAGSIPKEYYENIINRIKVEARLRIDEHFSPQDGAIRFSNPEFGNLDLRVSIIPLLDGEKIVIRILTSYVQDLTLSNIGLSEQLQNQILQSAQKPFGMILVTGPTGSGKTTTLYSLIKNLNTREINITTIEDPVEYKIDGINQIQANSQTNLTFAQGLRSIARQDPDVIFVGEIRDTETADIAVNAALTGHLLLSTFHANNASTAIPRFIDMGIEPFLLGSTLELIISQRLVRKICHGCKVSYDMKKNDLKDAKFDVEKYFIKTKTFYRGKGCALCHHTGYSGRIGIFECIKNSPDLQDLITKNPSTKDITDLIRGQGFASMFEDGVEKVKNGFTTLDELMRVIMPDM